MPYAVKWPDEFVERLQQWRNDHPKIGLLSPSFSKANGKEAVVIDCLEIFARFDDTAGNFKGFDKSDKVEAACKKKIAGMNRAQVIDGLDPAEKERLREQGNNRKRGYHAAQPAETKTTILAEKKTRNHDRCAALNEETRAAAVSHAETWGVPGAFDEQREFSQRFTDQENIIRRSCKSTSYLENIADDMFNTRVQLKMTNGMDAPVELMTVSDAVTRFRMHKFAFTAVQRQNASSREAEFFRGLGSSYPKECIYYAEIPLPSGCEFISPLDGAGPAHFRNVYGSGGYPIEQLLEARGGALKQRCLQLSRGIWEPLGPSLHQWRVQAPLSYIGFARD